VAAVFGIPAVFLAMTPLYVVAAGVLMRLGRRAQARAPAPTP
jgi:hypothetical protein